jgi:hypothetical protein
MIADLLALAGILAAAVLSAMTVAYCGAQLVRAVADALKATNPPRRGKAGP